MKLGYSRKEVAEAHGVSIRTIDKLIANNEIKVVRIGRRVIIADEEVRRLLSKTIYSTKPFSHEGELLEVTSEQR